MRHGLQIPLFARNDIIGQHCLVESKFCQRIAQHLQERRMGSSANSHGSGSGNVVARGHVLRRVGAIARRRWIPAFAGKTESNAAKFRGGCSGYVVARGLVPPWQPLRNSTKRTGLVFADEDSPSPLPSPSMERGFSDYGPGCGRAYTCLAVCLTRGRWIPAFAGMTGRIATRVSS